jgi:hypothetical protein
LALSYRAHDTIFCALYGVLCHARYRCFFHDWGHTDIAFGRAIPREVDLDLFDRPLSYSAFKVFLHKRR